MVTEVIVLRKLFFFVGVGLLVRSMMDYMRVENTQGLISYFSTHYILPAAAGMLLFVSVVVMKRRKVAENFQNAGSYNAMRELVLKVKPSELGLSSGNRFDIWGIVMEIGRSDVIETLVMSQDGSCSLYCSNGGGFIGMGEHKQVRQAAMYCLAIASHLKENFSEVSTFPLPSTKQVRFHFLTYSIPLGARAGLRQLEVGDHLLSPLYMAAQKVVKEMKIVGEKS